MSEYIPTPEDPIVIFSGIDFEDGVVRLTYKTLPQDSRGPLVAEHSLTIPWGSDYDDELAALVNAAEELLADALEDFGTYEPNDFSPNDDDEDDE